MNSYGEQAAQRHIEENAVIAMAALAGNLDALKALVAVAAQSGYTDGFGVAATTAGHQL